MRPSDGCAPGLCQLTIVNLRAVAVARWPPASVAMTLSMYLPGLSLLVRDSRPSKLIRLGPSLALTVNAPDGRVCRERDFRVFPVVCLMQRPCTRRPDT